MYAVKMGEAEDFKEMEADTAKLEKLKAVLDSVNSRLTELVEQGVLEASQKGYIIKLTKRVLEKLTVKYKKVTEGVDRIMGGYIIRTEIDDILEEGVQQGVQQGKIEQARETAVRLDAKGKTLEEIAEIVGFEQEMVKTWLSDETAAAV